MRSLMNLIILYFFIVFEKLILVALFLTAQIFILNLSLHLAFGIELSFSFWGLIGLVEFILLGITNVFLEKYDKKTYQDYLVIDKSKKNL